MNCSKRSLKKQNQAILIANHFYTFPSNKIINNILFLEPILFISVMEEQSNAFFKYCNGVSSNP